MVSFQTYLLSDMKHILIFLFLITRHIIERNGEAEVELHQFF